MFSFKNDTYKICYMYVTNKLARNSSAMFIKKLNLFVCLFEMKLYSVNVKSDK